MKRILFLITSILLSSVPTLAQERVIDATDSIPVSAASIFDFDGNVVGYTLADGTFSDIPKTAYPVTIRCLGYEPLVINQPKNAVWLMKQSFYDMPELVVVPVERNVMKQIFYIRKYLSLCSTADTITFFVEQMAYRFIPTAKDTKTGVSKSMHVSNHRCYSLYNIDDVDSVEYDVACKIKGKGTDLIHYTMSSKHSRFAIPSLDLSYETPMVDNQGHSIMHVTAESLKQALAQRMDNIEVVSVGSVPIVSENYDEGETKLVE